jgi:SAM-dependent methyltransferase
LEVGAGIGATTRILCKGKKRSWTCLEPDAELADRLIDSLHNAALSVAPSVMTATVSQLPSDQQFDTILYIDVLEHIENDANELLSAARHLRPNGMLIVLSPAHQMLYTPFDRAIGHFRRYDKASMKAILLPGLKLQRSFYLDSVGLLASLGNRLLLKSSMPTPKQIWLWDRLMVPLSRWLDPILGFRIGKSIVAIWQ